MKPVSRTLVNKGTLPIFLSNNISPIKDFLRLLQGNIDAKISQGVHNVTGVHLTWQETN